jgi:hypothetical protein
MGLFSRLAGTVSSFFQIGGPSGPGLNANGTALEVKNSANSAFAVARGAYPLGDNDLTTKAYVDEVARPFIVTAQANAPSALLANSGVEHYIVVSAAGTGAAAAYVAGSVLLDDGSGVGNVAILGPTDGQPIFVTTSLTGGTFVFSANTIYLWTGSTWQSSAPSVAGVDITIAVAIGTAATTTSVTSIPANAIILRSTINVTTPYSALATIAVGQTGSTGLLQGAADGQSAQVANTYDAPQTTSWGGSSLPVVVTITGSPSLGAGVVYVTYTSPLS